MYKPRVGAIRKANRNNPIWKSAEETNAVYCKPSSAAEYLFYAKQLLKI